MKRKRGVTRKSFGGGGVTGCLRCVGATTVPRQTPGHHFGASQEARSNDGSNELTPDLEREAAHRPIAKKALSIPSISAVMEIRAESSSLLWRMWTGTNRHLVFIYVHAKCGGTTRTLSVVSGRALLARCCSCCDAGALLSLARGRRLCAPLLCLGGALDRC